MRGIVFMVELCSCGRGEVSGGREGVVKEMYDGGTSNIERPTLLLAAARTLRVRPTRPCRSAPFNIQWRTREIRAATARWKNSGERYQLPMSSAVPGWPSGPAE